MSDKLFLRFLGRLTSRLTAVQADGVDDEVVRSLEALVNELGTDRATFYQFDTETRDLVSQRQWARPGIPLDPTIAAREFPWFTAKMLAGETIVMNAPSELPPEAEAERRFCERLGLRSNVSMPVSVGGRLVSVIATGTFAAQRSWSPEDVERLRIVGEVLAGAVDRRNRDLELTRSLEEVRVLRDELAAENDLLREELGSSHDFLEIVGESPALKRMLALVSQVAPTGATVLLVGETGTGKELLARAIHERSPRRGRTMIRVNCAAIPPSLIESELFGHEKGAFTGAIATKIGRFDLANGGTLFLDEIGDLGLDLQTKLLRVLQEGEFERVGSGQTRRVDVRLVAATHHDLPAAVDSGRFRADLFYRLNVFPVRVPPLRERREDVPLLVWWFVHRRQKEMGRQIERIPRRAMDRLTAYPWPGNVRELENVVERALILSPGSTLLLDEAFGGGTPAGPGVAGGGQTIEAVERAHVEAVLERFGGRVEGPGNAAAILGLKPSTLRSRMKKLGIRRA